MTSPFSILVADIGQTMTHVALIEPVEGVYRFIAKGQCATVWSGTIPDLESSLKSSVNVLEEIIQRRLWNDNGPIKPRQENGYGIDALIVTTSATPALRTVIIGLTNAYSLESARRAVIASGATIEMTLGIGESSTPWSGETLTSLVQDPPDLIVLTGGTDQGSTKPIQSTARSLAMLYQASPAHVPHLIYAGNLEARRAVIRNVEGILPFSVVDNVRPTPDTEAPSELQREILSCYENLCASRCIGFAHLQNWVDAPIISTPRAIGLTARFVAQSNNNRRGVFIAATSPLEVVIAAAKDDDYRWLWQRTQPTELSLDQDVDRILEVWPRPTTREEITQMLLDALANPLSMAQTYEEHLAMLAWASLRVHEARNAFIEIYSRQNTKAPAPNSADLYVIQSQAFSGAEKSGAALLSILKALQPTGLARFLIDDQALLPQLGALARIAPLAALQVLENDALTPMATVISTRGKPRGDRAIKLEYSLDSGVSSEMQINTGTIARIALERSQSAMVQAHPQRGIDIGLGKPGRGGRAAVYGGGLGLVIDTRHNNSVNASQATQQEKVEGWLRALDEPLG